MNKVVYLQPQSTLPSNTPKEDYQHFLENKDKYPNVVQWQNTPEYVNDQHFYHSQLPNYEYGDHLPYHSPFHNPKPIITANHIAFLLITFILGSSLGLEHLCIKGIQMPFIEILSIGAYILGAFLAIHAAITWLDRREYRSNLYRFHMDSQYKQNAFTLSLYSALCITIPTYLTLWSATCIK